MARSIQNFDGQVIAPNTDYPVGDIKDDTGSDDGTRINRTSNSDIQQFFQKLMRIGNVTPNGMPDNEYTGFQLIEALQKASNPYKIYSGKMSQTGTADPTGNIYNYNTIGPIVWTRNATGDYFGTLALAFPTTTTQVFISGSELGFVKIKRGSSGTIEILTTDLAGTPSDSILSNTAFEIRVNNSIYQTF